MFSSLFVNLINSRKYLPVVQLLENFHQIWKAQVEHCRGDAPVCCFWGAERTWGHPDGLPRDSTLRLQLWLLCCGPARHEGGDGYQYQPHSLISPPSPADRGAVVLVR